MGPGLGQPQAGGGKPEPVHSTEWQSLLESPAPAVSPCLLHSSKKGGTAMFSMACKMTVGKERQGLMIQS